MHLPFRNEGEKSFFLMLEPEGFYVEVAPGDAVELRLVPREGPQSMEIDEDGDVVRIYSLAGKEIWKHGSRVTSLAGDRPAYRCPQPTGAAWQLATGNWQLATGNWQLATGNWKLLTSSDAFS